jgi:hypothetical protein
MRIVLSIKGLLAAVGLATASCAIANDDFNRPDGGLGSNWTTIYGAPEIFNGQARSDGGTGRMELAIYNGEGGNWVEFDLMHGSSNLQYGAAVLGWGGSKSYFVKVQDNGVGQFDKFGFYVNNNDGGSFDFLDSPFTDGRIRVSIDGSVATLTITPTLGETQVYSYDYGFVSEGSGVGLGFYNDVRIDNFRTAINVVPEPATWAMMIVGFGLIGGALRRREHLTFANA